MGSHSLIDARWKLAAGRNIPLSRSFRSLSPEGGLVTLSLSFVDPDP
jgi:hypothetical protein